MAYPTKKVLCVYGLSPAILSTLIWLITIISLKKFNAEQLIDSLCALLVFNLFGMSIGIVPAVLTGLVAVYFKLHRTFTHISILSLAGFMFTLITMKVIPGNSDTGYGLIGAFCALCIAIFVLPKKDTLTNVAEPTTSA
jgi:hypothetical protein